MIDGALRSLDAAGVAYALRGPQPIHDQPRGGDVDVLVGARDARAAARALEAAGFRRLRAPGHEGHRFFLAFDAERGTWLKLDLNLVPARLGWDLGARDPASLARFAGYRVGVKAGGRAQRVRMVLARRLPLAPRRCGAVVAILGPDGAGKGTVIEALRRELPVTVTVVYLGNSRGGPRRERAAARAARGALRLLPRGLRERQHRARHALRAAARAWRAAAYAWRGDVVLCDRHPLDALVLEPDGGRLAARLAPTPDAVVVLDAPGDVLFARKGEHSPELLERWRRRYRDVLGPRGATIVPTTDGVERAVGAASAVAWHALAARRNW